MSRFTDKGYKETDVFITGGKGSHFKEGTIVRLYEDDGDIAPWFVDVTVKNPKRGPHAYPVTLENNRIRRLWPNPESDMVSLTVAGKTVEISWESAKALNLVQ